MTHLLRQFLAFTLALLTLLPFLRRAYRRGELGSLGDWWRRASRLARSLAFVAFFAVSAYAADKLFGNRVHEVLAAVPQTAAALCTNIFNATERQTGYAVSEAHTNDIHDLTMPEGARLAESIARRGAHDDGFYLFDSFTNRLAREGLDLENPVWIQTDGTITVRSPAPGIPIEELSLYTTYSNITVYAPLQGSFGFLPGIRWPDFQPSRIWLAVTDRNTRVITWEGAFRDRDTAQPVSFQAEFHQNGDITYRYSPAQTNFTGIGIYRGGAAMSVDSFIRSSVYSLDSQNSATNIFHFPLSTLHLSYIGDLGDGTGDTDNDGLTDWQEVKLYHTDPHHPDTDLDSLVDDDEVAIGSNPNSRDTDGDGLVDGSDPEPLAENPLDDLDGDGLPDAYEIHWFGGTNVYDSATDRDETGFTLQGKMLAGINPTNEVREAFVVATHSCVAWHLFDGFAMDIPEGMTNLVWERTFQVDRSSAWQQFFLSASPTNAAAWNLRNARLEWETDTGLSGFASSSPHGDSFRIPLAADDFPSSLTLRIRATSSSTVLSPNPVHLVAYAPEFRVEGGREVTDADGGKTNVFLDGADSQIWLAIDHAHRPCKAPIGPDECDLGPLEDLWMSNDDFWFYGDANGGSIYASRPGICTLPAFPQITPPAARLRSTRRGTGGGTVIVLDPSVAWNCNGHGCGYDGLVYDWDWNWYYEEDHYPLDSVCLRKKWYRGWSGGWLQGSCELSVSSGLRDDGGGHVTTSTEGNTGKVYVDGVEVWSGSAEHVYDDAACAGGYHEDFLGDECDSCDDDCANGNCDSLEGPSLGSLKFRIPLGAPVKGQVAGFAWLSSEGPVSISKSTFQLLAHPCATIDDTEVSGTRRIVCHDSRGRDLRIENIANGARVTIRETASQKLEHTWEIVNVDGDQARVRLRKISRLDNVMSDETYTYAGGNWTRFDNIAGVQTRLTIRDNFADYGDGMRTETRTTTDAGGKTLSSVMTYQNRIGACDNAVLRETFRYESTGRGEKWTRAEYWDDPAHSARHGQPRLVYGNARPWVYTDFDDFGHEILRVEQRGNSPVPWDFPTDFTNELMGVQSSTFHFPLSTFHSDAYVTVRDYTPLDGDACHPDDAAKPRTETRYVVADGVATLIGRTFTRYTRLTRDGHDAIKAETWRTTNHLPLTTDHSSAAYSYEISYADTGDGTPLLIRNALAESLDEDGILTVNSYALTNGLLVCESRRFNPSTNHLPLTTFPIYETTERDASYGTLLRSTVRLTDGDTIIADEQSVYDEKNRLRCTTYLNGTSITNAYSCCRLLWQSDTERRKVLRSAQTGTDHLYNALEEVWLGDVSTNGQYRITQHFYDALGRETNTVVYAGATPGEATVASSSNGKAYTTVTTTYPYGGDDYVVRTDERGKVTITATDILADCIETTETVLTNDVVVLTTKTSAYFGGGSSTRREWGAAMGGPGFVPAATMGGPGAVPAAASSWTEERRFTDYDADGRRIEYVVTESSDCGTVTNSVTTFDLLGRLVSSAVPSANGSTITTAHTYDGSTSRVLSTATTAGDIVRTTQYLYNDFGEQIGSVRDGITIRTDVAYETDASNITWRVTTERTFGDSTNACTTIRERLTGLSDQCRSYTETLTLSGGWTRSSSSFNAETGLLTGTSESSAAGTTTVVKSKGFTVETHSASGDTYTEYNALGRVVVTSRSLGESPPMPLQAFTYAPCGDLIAKSSYTNGTDTIVESYSYDMFGNRIVTTDALGNTVFKSYDPFGLVIAEWGATYPVRFTYDTQGRRTSLSTTRDGNLWDTTTWAYDAPTGLCTSKTYADGSSVTYTYTSDNLLLRTTCASGRWKENEYDVSRRLVAEISGGGSGGAGGSPAEINTSSYDAFSQTIGESNAVASVTYLRDALGNCTNETTAVADTSHVIDREYDSNSRLVRHGDTYYTYASDGRLTAISNAEAIVEYAYTFDRFDAGYTLTLTNGTMFSRAVVRDDYRRSLVTAITNSVNGVPVETFAYIYDALGHPIARCRGAGGSPAVTNTFGYNDRSEVVSATIAGGSPSPATASYGYDDIGNSTNFIANCLNQYTLCGSVPLCEFTYDLDGNMLTNGVFSYAYDAANRLSSVTSNSVALASFAYDAQGRRVRKVTASATHTYFYDGWLLVRETLVTSNSSLVTDYVWGKDVSGARGGAAGIGGLLYLRRNGAIFVPRFDAYGNVMGYCDAQGNVVASYTYDAFGNTIAQSGSMAGDFAFRFSTKYFDREVNLYYYGYRYYCPILMRWLSRDPIQEEGGVNLYAFCGNNATDKTDFLGMAILLVMNAKEDSYEQNIAKCIQIVKSDVEKLDKMGEKQFNKLVSCKKIAFNGELFSGSFSEYKELVSHELTSCVHVEREYSSSISKLQSLAQKADKSYDFVVYCAHGSLWEVNESKVSVFFSDCILPQATVIESANKSMSPAKGKKMVVSCYQTWDGKGDATKTKERLTIYTPGFNMISLKSSGNETSSGNKNPSDDKKDVLNFDVIRVEKVFGVP